MYTKKLYIYLFLLLLIPLRMLPAQMYQDFNLYTKFNAMVTHSNTKVSGQYMNKAYETTTFLGGFNGYFMYSLFYNAFYVSLAPQFTMKDSQPHVLLKEFFLSYSFDTLEISLGKTKENRYLTNNKDYLTIHNRTVSFIDEFSFWKLSMYVPLEYISFELGTKLIREHYKLEWVDFDTAFSKNYLYVDFDYEGFSSHVGYAYTYDLPQKSYSHDISAKMLYNYKDIIAGYFANLILLPQNKVFYLSDYSYTIGMDFSFVNAFGTLANNFDVTINAELIYEQEKYSIAAPHITFFYDDLSVFNMFSYTFDTKKMSNISVIQYTVGTVTFRIVNTFLYFINENKNYKQKHVVHTFGLEVVYEL